MPGAPVGKLIAELDLDASRYLKGQQRLLQDATRTTLNIEKNFKNLGIKSSAEMDLMRAKIENSFNRIKNSSQATKNDILRAEKAANAQLLRLHEEQFGKQFSLLGTLKSNWMAYGAVIASVGYTMKSAFEKGFKAVEDYNQSVAALAAFVVTFSKRGDESLESQWKNALAYSSQMVPILEQIAAKTLLSGEETTALANALARSGVFLDATNAKQIEAFTRISNALPLMTQGQEIMRQINTEIRSLMNGNNEASSMLLTTLKAIDPNLEKNLKTWRDQGTVLEHIGDLLVGFGPATELLENQWQTVKSTIDTTATQILRGLMKPAYDEIIDKTKVLNESLKRNKDNFAAWGESMREQLDTLSQHPFYKLNQTLFMLMFGPKASPQGWSGWDVLRGGDKNKLTKEEWLNWQLSFRGNPAGAFSGGGLGFGLTTVPPPGAAPGPDPEELKRAAEAYARLKEQANDYRRTLESNIAAGEAGGLRGELIKIQREADDLKDKFKGLKGNDKTIMYGLIDKDQLRKENEAVTKETERQRKLAVDGVKKETDLTIKLNKDAIDKANDRLQAERDIYKDLRGYSGDYYEAQKQLIASQAETYRNLGIEEVAIAQWVLKELRNAEIEKLKASENFFDGWRAGLMQMQDDLMTWGKAGEEMFRSVAENGRSVMSDVLFDGVKGELQSFSEYWKSFSDALLRQFTDIVAQMVIEWALGMDKMKAIKTGASWIGSAVGLIGGLFGGGSSAGTSGVPDEQSWQKNGNAFHRGRVTAFANGGVVSRPTLFPMANGMGLMGEAGPEAVMPLKRTSSGRLGVEGGGMTISVPVTINGDASKGMAAKLSRAIEETVRKTVKDLM